MRVLNLLTARAPLKRALQTPRHSGIASWLPLTLTYASARQSAEINNRSIVHQYSILLTHKFQISNSVLPLNVLPRLLPEKVTLSKTDIVKPLFYRSERTDNIDNSVNKSGKVYIDQSMYTSRYYQLAIQNFCNAVYAKRVNLFRHLISNNRMFNHLNTDIWKNNNVSGADGHFSTVVMFSSGVAKDDRQGLTDSYVSRELTKQSIRSVVSQYPKTIDVTYQPGTHKQRDSVFEKLLLSQPFYRESKRVAHKVINQHIQLNSRLIDRVRSVTIDKALHTAKQTLSESTHSINNLIVHDKHEYRKTQIRLPAETINPGSTKADSRNLRSYAPVSVVYRTQRAPNVASANNSEPVLAPQKNQAIDITRISRDVMREIKKRQRVELERRGML